MKHFKNYWWIYFSIILYILGMYHYSQAYGSETFCYEYQGSYYTFEHPEAIESIKQHFNQNYNTLDTIANNKKKNKDKNENKPVKKSTKSNNKCYDDCETNAEKVRFHKSNGIRTFNDAKDRCWYLPKLSHREKARYCFTNIGAVLSNSTPQSKIVATVVITLIQYGLDCTDEWNYIKNKLYWSQYHFEMMEFHQELINQGYP